jgi:hypothetical protein
MNSEPFKPLSESEREYINTGVTRAMNAINEIALNMPEGPISQQSLLIALMKAYNAGRDSK